MPRDVHICYCAALSNETHMVPWLRWFMHAGQTLWILPCLSCRPLSRCLPALLMARILDSTLFIRTVPLNRTTHPHSSHALIQTRSKSKRCRCVYTINARKSSAWTTYARGRKCSASARWHVHASTRVRFRIRVPRTTKKNRIIAL